LVWHALVPDVRTLDRLWVLRDFTLDDLNALKNASPSLLKEIKRLEQLDAIHAARFAASSK
jgi:hypothetical protein